MMVAIQTCWQRATLRALLVTNTQIQEGAPSSPAA